MFLRLHHSYICYLLLARMLFLPLCQSWVVRRRVFARRAITTSQRWMSNEKETEDPLVALQHQVSQGSREMESFLEHQERVFDEMAERYFATDQAVQPHVEAILEALASRILHLHVDLHREDENPSMRLRVLDVACGTGPLFQPLLKAADQLDLSLHITGIDLSSKMIQQAHIHEKKLTYDRDRHEIELVHCDVFQHALDTKYDIITANSCFGNFPDREQTMEDLTDLLNMSGVLFVLHPLGANFVRQLHEKDPATVPHALPTLHEWDLLTRYRPLESIQFLETLHLASDDTTATLSYPVYAAGAVKVRHRALTQVLRLRGPVARGYGRGGKKLGFPTANLPSSQFQGALQDVPAGVYLGWVVVEDASGQLPGRNVPHKAVVNVGFSPTFEGEENKEKIVEAYLMVDNEATPLTDFYGETMRLQLNSFLRPEMKFPSFSDLVAQIQADVRDAKRALDMHPFAALKTDAFLIDPVVNHTGEWIGSTGGNSTSSWEFESMSESLDALPPSHRVELASE